MKNIALADTSAATMNIGVDVIMECTRKELSGILENNIVCTFPTHTPMCHSYQVGKTDYTKWIEEADYKFISGTNLLKMNMLKRSPLWNVNIFNYRPLKDSILVGVGRAGQVKELNWYTKLLYKKLLSKNYIHSVRDEETKNILEDMGFRAINTGCITLWGLTNEFCAKINKTKQKNVVTSFNCKSPDIDKDNKVIRLLKDNYEKIYFWPQTIGDIEYFNKLSNIEGIEIISNSLNRFAYILENEEVDYVGARLHGGIFCMHHYIRTIILSVDYRSTDMQKTYNINCVPREDINEIEKMIQSELDTKVNVDQEKIDAWLSQF